MPKISFQLVTPERTVLKEELDSLTCQTDMGQITVLPGHIPLVANLVSGELHAKAGGKDFYLYVAGGFVQVKPGSEVTILADDAEHHYAIDIQKAMEAKERAQKALHERQMSGREYAKVANALNQSLVKLNIARKHAHRRGAPMTSTGTFEQ